MRNDSHGFGGRIGNPVALGGGCIGGLFFDKSVQCRRSASGACKNVKILYLTVSMPFGPGEAFFIAEVREMLRQGCEMRIVPRSPSGDCVNQDAAGLDQISLRKPLIDADIFASAVGVAVRHPIRCLRALIKFFHGRNLAALVKNLTVFPKSLWLAKLAKQWGADHIHAQWALTTATMAMAAADISGVSWSCTAHRGDIIDNNLLELKARRASFFRIISEDGVQLATEICGRPLQGNLVMLHLGVEMPAAIHERPPLQSPPVLLCPAHLIERKGQQYLIEAIALLRRRGRKLRLQLAGEGNMRKPLQALIARLELEDSVTFLGQVEHDRLLRFYETGAVDMVVLPTLHEGIPVCLIEAMAYGIPVISTPTGGIPELLRDEAGILVPTKDPAVLADAIERLLGDSSLQRRLSEAGRRRVETEYGVKNVVSELLRLVDKSVSVSTRLDK
jgi:colanic acid/amylovoran biosynthesis glycosyltransferase